jgi:hypothetical protein
MGSSIRTEEVVEAIVMSHRIESIVGYSKVHRMFLYIFNNFILDQLRMNGCR